MGCDEIDPRADASAETNTLASTHAMNGARLDM
jgi:hypothetical protein